MRFSVLLVLVFFMQLMLAHAASVCDKDTCVKVDVVSSVEDMERGLQGREGLSDGTGMLFIFDYDDLLRFWMKDMKFAIDMIWIDNSKRIVTIAPSKPPCKEDPCEVYEPSENARYVLEVSDGFSLKHQIKVGDIVEFKDIK